MGRIGTPYFSHSLTVSFSSRTFLETPEFVEKYPIHPEKTRL